MIIEPKVRGFICTTAHPQGCKKNVENEVAFFKKAGSIPSSVKKVLILGGSTGYGLSSRIAATWCLGAATLNVSLEREPSENRIASPGWYNTKTLETMAQNEGIYAQSIFKDGFLEETKKETLEKIKKDLGKIDMLIYSIAAARRFDEKANKQYQSVLKPIGKEVKAKSVHWKTKELSEITLEPATKEEIEATVKVMGGEDWSLWVEALKKGDLLSENFTTVAYSYVGPAITQDIYRNGTIGEAKKDLEKTASHLNELLKPNGKAYVAVNKAIVTQASAAIPIIPLYLSLLFRVMKKKGLHEDAAQQINRLFREKLFSSDAAKKNDPIIRVDDWEMRPDVQEEVTKLWEEVRQENLLKISDIELYGKEFLKLFGFEVESVDYRKETTTFL